MNLSFRGSGTGPDAELRVDCGAWGGRALCYISAGVRALLNRGVLAAGNGLMALSTPMTDADIDAIITAVSGALSEVSASL